MQPYFFPHIAYFQLLDAVDRWIVYDDVAFIKGGWINRNFLLVSDQKWLFSVPLAEASPHRAIRETRIDGSRYDRWSHRFLRTVDQSYAKAVHYAEIRVLLDRVLRPAPATVAELAVRAQRETMAWLGMATSVEWSSSTYENAHLAGQDRVLDICRREGATIYVNSIGGRALYDEADFGRAGIDLRFLVPGPTVDRVAGLSVLHAMFQVPRSDLSAMLSDRRLARPAEVDG